MTINEKNKYIEDYIRNISSRINSQYGKELVDEDKISRALTIFKDSQDDLETEIIPKINELAQQIIDNFIEHQKQREEMMERQREISELINKKIEDLNKKYPNLVSDNLRSSAVNNYINSDKPIEEIKKEISDKLTFMSQAHEEEITMINSVKPFNPDQLDTKLKTNSQGVYLSSLMITALSLINCSNIDEINRWIDSVPNLYVISQLQNADYSPEQIEVIKRKLFDVYQDSMISTDAIKEINNGDKEEAMRYALHKKLRGLNLSLEDELKLGDIGLSQGLPALYKEAEKICIKEFGEEKGSKISSKIVYYFTTDYENFNSTTYEQMQALNEEIKSNIQKCNASGGDLLNCSLFQHIILKLNYL